VLRVLDTGAAPPAWNLALDEALWRAFDGVPVLRCYGWRPEGLSLGRFQPLAATVAAIPLPPGTPVVRRSTGGGAIFHHAGELTYSVVVDLRAAGLPRDVTGSYAALHGLVARALAHFGVDAAERGAPDAHPDDAQALCFERRMPVDLLAAGRKLCGSAQRRRGDVLLQQGSILLAPNPLVPACVSVADLATVPCHRDDLARALARAAAGVLGEPAEPGTPTSAELALAAEIRAARYGHPSWTARVP
jgi:lipoate-protein ligase A